MVQKICGGCGHPAEGEIGQFYYCAWVLRNVPIKLKRTPLWKSPPAIHELGEEG